MWIILGNINMQTMLIAVVGYIIVFSALVLLFAIFNFLPKLINMRIRKKSKAKGIELPDDSSMTGEEIAAISMALHMHFAELHDEESGVLTIKRISRAYSPWSSKIYAVRNQFNRR